MTRPRRPSEPEHRLVVDRIEGERAVLTVGTETIDVPCEVLPKGAKEGSILTLVLSDATERRLREEKDRLKRLRSRTPKRRGPVDL